MPGQVSVDDGLTITAIAKPTVCGDFNLDGSVRHAPQSWPYATGDIQWNTFDFTYGTLTYRARFPGPDTSTWPAIWLMDGQCQQTTRSPRTSTTTHARS